MPSAVIGGLAQSEAPRFGGFLIIEGRRASLCASPRKTSPEGGDSFHNLKPANFILVDVEHVDVGVQAPGSGPGESICLLQGFWQLWVDVAGHYPALEIPFGGDQEALFG
jgi:hypothetical protein